MAEAQAPKSKGMERVKGLDLYELLGVEVTSIPVMIFSHNKSFEVIANTPYFSGDQR